jgi:hypothetical protein
MNVRRKQDERSSLFGRNFLLRETLVLATNKLQKGIFQGD